MTVRSWTGSARSLRRKTSCADPSPGKCSTWNNRAHRGRPGRECSTWNNRVHRGRPGRECSTWNNRVHRGRPGRECSTWNNRVHRGRPGRGCSTWNNRVHRGRPGREYSTWNTRAHPVHRTPTGAQADTAGYRTGGFRARSSRGSRPGRRADSWPCPRSPRLRSARRCPCPRSRPRTRRAVHRGCGVHPW